MKYKIEEPETLLNKKNSENSVPIYTLQNIHKMIVTSIIQEINNNLIKYNNVRISNNNGLKVIINRSLMEILFSDVGFSHSPIHITTEPNYFIGKLSGIEVKVDLSNYLNHNEYCFNKDAAYISHLNKKLKKISKI